METSPKILPEKLKHYPEKFFHNPEDEPLDHDDVCPNCGSDQVEYLQKNWVTCNGGNHCSGYEEDNPEYWCPKCEDHPSEVIDYIEWKEKK